ncbi:hypothetical protein SIL85_22895 [Shewanella oneidensis]|uniref:Toxin-antitoxin system toxin RelE family n=1 Tax=Shewanella oneidensis (strain ATCC 700550 / JCM 31522 / CIP 106686 / LMG 19005 / NCIMB 14063 / MR-1) TaxID=211586 RepID=Q8E809_SHEON|nr:hypothetical protein [Shewanella oneidensis]AAN53068.1 toxin-antitoxin system toxin RelE family [Shewanella oneidensis MR-1]MDX5999807.1 hypothetical protein [Shewanella oneidensis]MEE2030209.1 hypothetical protein [Shewanella oneidensis]
MSTHKMRKIHTAVFKVEALKLADKIYLVLAYPKAVKDSLTAEEKAKLKLIVQSLKGESK